MKEYHLRNVAETNLPAEISKWGKVKSFLFQEIDLNTPIILELTPKQAKVIEGIHSFFTKEIKLPTFSVPEIPWFGKKDK